MKSCLAWIAFFLVVAALVGALVVGLFLPADRLATHIVDYLRLGFINRQIYELPSEEREKLDALLDKGGDGAEIIFSRVAHIERQPVSRYASGFGHYRIIHNKHDLGYISIAKHKCLDFDQLTSAILKADDAIKLNQLIEDNYVVGLDYLYGSTGWTMKERHASRGAVINWLPTMTAMQDLLKAGKFPSLEYFTAIENRKRDTD